MTRAFHGAEIPYVFGMLDRLYRLWTAVDPALSETMIGCAGPVRVAVFTKGMQARARWRQSAEMTDST